jgi:Holliday junction resolvasome RuvABC endonuclease subunit
MIVLGIDQSYTSTGIVIADATSILHAEAYASDTDFDIYSRAWEISEHIVQLARQFGVTHVTIEGLAFGKFGNATRDLAGLQFILYTRIWKECGITPHIVNPLTLKKFATNSGKAKKKDMIAAIPSQDSARIMSFGTWKKKQMEDIADGYWLARYAFV